MPYHQGAVNGKFVVFKGDAVALLEPTSLGSAALYADGYRRAQAQKIPDRSSKGDPGRIPVAVKLA